MNRKHLRVSLCALLVAGSALSGCAAAGDLTCKDYLGFDSSQRESLIRDLLREHDLQTLNVSNRMNLSTALRDFCANPANENAPLEQATDWNNTY